MKSYKINVDEEQGGSMNLPSVDDTPPKPQRLAEIAPYNWFSGGDRISVHADGTVEIQHCGVAYRAEFKDWVRLARIAFERIPVARSGEL